MLVVLAVLDLICCTLLMCTTDAGYLRNIPGSSNKTYSETTNSDTLEEELSAIKSLQMQCQSELDSLPTSVEEDLRLLHDNEQSSMLDLKEYQAISLRAELKMVIQSAIEHLKMYHNYLTAL